MKRRRQVEGQRSVEVKDRAAGAGIHLWKPARIEVAQEKLSRETLGPVDVRETVVGDDVAKRECRKHEERRNSPDDRGAAQRCAHPVMRERGGFDSRQSDHAIAPDARWARAWSARLCKLARPESGQCRKWQCHKQRA